MAVTARHPGYTVIDVETTGFSPTVHDRIVELAVVYVSSDGDIEDRWSTLINPQRDVGPTRIHGITATDVQDAPTFSEVAPYVLRAISDRVLVGHNASFDLRFLVAELNAVGVRLEEERPSSVCTMQWSRYFVDSASRRLSDCCKASGIALEEAHTASADAMASARLLCHFLRASSFRPPWQSVVEAAGAFVWPRFRGPFSDFRLSPRSRTRARAERWLDLIVAGMPRAADPRVDAYLDVLEMALLDGVLTSEEIAALIAVAREHQLSRGQVMDIHSAYLESLAEVALSDGVVTDTERDVLIRAAGLLGLPASDVDQALAASRSRRSASAGAARLATAGLLLRPGDRVALTGDMQLSRSDWECELRATGLEPGGLTRTTKVLAAADPNSLSGKAKQARAYGVPIIDEGALRLLVDRLRQGPVDATAG